MSDSDLDVRKLRTVLDGLDGEIGRLVSRRDSIAAELIRHKGKPPYDPAREHCWTAQL